MTQEQAQELLATVNGKLEMKRLEAVNLLFREIDELKMMEEDAQQYALKCRKELEALQQPKSCVTCKHWGKSISGYFSGRTCNKMVCSPHNKENYTDSNFGCNLFEPKEQ